MVAVNFSVLLPLYIYPSASTWKPLYDAITAYPNVNFHVVVSPNVGPGAAIPDSNYITGLAQLNSYTNVHTFGYVYSGYGNRRLSSMQSDVDVYQTWNQYTSSDIHVDGVFIDGTPSNTQYLALLQGITNYAKTTLTGSGLVYLNPGRPVDPSFYSFVEYVNAYEDVSAYANDATAGIPAIANSVVLQSSIIIHHYSDTTTQLKTDTCNYIAQGFAGGLITTSDGNFNDFSNYWAQYVAAVSACLGGSTTNSTSPSSSVQALSSSAVVAPVSAAPASSSAIKSSAALTSSPPLITSSSVLNSSSIRPATSSAVNSASLASVSSASAASVSSAAAASSASVASVSSASVASVSSASVASVSSASVASVSSASVASVSRVQASKTSGCTTVTNTATPSDQILINPSFEWVDSTCAETIYPWTTNNMITYNNKQTKDGKYYISAYQNNAYLTQSISSTNYGTYALSLYYRMPAAWSGGSSTDTCNFTITLDSKTLYTNRLIYGSTTMNSVTQNQISVSNVTYQSTNAGAFTVGWQCTTVAKVNIDLDYITLTRTA